MAEMPGKNLSSSVVRFKLLNCVTVFSNDPIVLVPLGTVLLNKFELYHLFEWKTSAVTQTHSTTI